MTRAAIITAFDPRSFKGGIETFTLQLEALLKERGVSCDVYFADPAAGTGDFHSALLGMSYRTGRMIDDSRYDFIVANSFYGMGYFPPRVKTFNIYHSTHKGLAEAVKDSVPRMLYLEWKWLWGDLAEGVSGYDRVKVAVSESVRDELTAYYGFDDVRVVANGVDTEIFKNSDRQAARDRLGIPADAFVGLYVGRWEIPKGSDVLDAVIERTPDVLWLVATCTGGADILPGRGNIRALREVEHEQMGHVYSAADFLIFPSSYEGFGYAFIEAMACGLPVIATSVGVAKTLLREEPFSLLGLPVPSAGKDAMVRSCLEKIGLLRNGQGLGVRMSEEGRERVVKEYSLSRWKKEMADVLGV